METSLCIITSEMIENKQLFLLVQKNNEHTFPIACMVVEIQKFAIFIEAVDTTGLFEPRNLQRWAVKAFIYKSIEYLRKQLQFTDEFHLECFSHPKKDLLFIYSSSNRFFPTPKSLISYWHQIFSILCQNVIVWSNFMKKTNVGENPLKSLVNTEMFLFDDDPKNKQMKSLHENCENTDIKSNEERETKKSSASEDSEKFNEVQSKKSLKEKFKENVSAESEKVTETQLNWCTKVFTDEFKVSDFYTLLLTRRDFNSGGIVIGTGQNDKKSLNDEDLHLLEIVNKMNISKFTIFNDKIPQSESNVSNSALFENEKSIKRIKNEKNLNKNTQFTEKSEFGKSQENCVQGQKNTPECKKLTPLCHFIHKIRHFDWSTHEKAHASLLELLKSEKTKLKFAQIDIKDFKTEEKKENSPTQILTRKKKTF